MDKQELQDKIDQQMVDTVEVILSRLQGIIKAGSPEQACMAVDKFLALAEVIF